MSRAIYVCCFLTIAIVFLLHAAHLGVVAEDAYISFRFAKNLASGNGLVWNVGEPPVEGYTNFLWVILSAAALLAGLDVGLFAQGAGVVASLVTLAYSYLFCRRLCGLGPRLSLLPCAYLASAGPFATWATSGMETNLFAMLVVSSSYHMVSYWRRRNRIQISLAFLLAFLATLTRPEGLGLFCVLVGMHCIRAVIRNGSKELGKCILAAAFYLLPFAVYFAWRLGYYGYLFPNTFYAKTGGTIYQWFRGIKYILYFALHYGCPVAPLLSAIVWEVAGRGRGAGRTPILRMVKRRIKEHYGPAVCVSLCLCYSAYILFVGGDYMAMYRFFVPILPLAYILLAQGCKVLTAEASASSSKRMVATALAVVGMVATFLHSTPLERHFFAKPTISHGQYRGVLIERWHSQRLSAIGRFFNDYKGGDGESLATGAIGAVSYYSNLRIYGFHGNVDPHIAHQKREGLGRGLPGHEKSDFAYVLAKRPTYFMFTRVLTEKPCDFPRSYSREVTALMKRHYEVVSKWIEDKENAESGYFCFLQRKPDGRR